jgi:hypothetical protein
MLEKIIPSILAVLLPFILTYLNKRGKANIRKGLIEDALKKIDFLDRYFEVSSKLLAEPEITSLKAQLSTELFEVKNKLTTFDDESHISDYQKLSSVQKLFLTFKPASTMGWVWSTLFYLNLVFLSFAVLGLFVNADGDFTMDAFTTNSQDTDTLIGTAFFVITLLIFRWLSIRNFKSKSFKGIPAN